MPLVVVTDELDGRWRELVPFDREYRMATYARSRQDDWTDDEHREYWEAHLPLWPSVGHRATNREGLAYALLLTKVRHDATTDDALSRMERSMAQLFDEEERPGVEDDDDAISLLGMRRKDLRDRGVLDVLRCMEAELDAPPSPVRVPRVVVPPEREFEVPHLPFLRRNMIGRRTVDIPLDRLPVEWQVEIDPGVRLPDLIDLPAQRKAAGHARNDSSQRSILQAVGAASYFHVEFDSENGDLRRALRGALRSLDRIGVVPR